MVYRLASIVGLIWLCLCSAGVYALDEVPVVANLTELSEISAERSVSGFHEALLKVMQVEDMSQRESMLAPEIHTRFDLGRIAGVSLGRTWKTLDQAQRAMFKKLLGELIVATYADRFESYSGQEFTVQAITKMKSGYVVQTLLHRRDGEPVRLDYFLKDAGIFNVVADGVSDLSLRRADYNSIIKTQGYDALLAHMRDKIELARGAQ